MITTDRLILRDWRAGDLAPFHKMNRDPQVVEHLFPPHTLANSEAAIARYGGYARELGHTFWALERRGDGAFLGFCGLKRAAEGPPLGLLEIGWRLQRDAWGHGFAREAAAACLAWAQEHRPGEPVVAITIAGNVRSWRLMERLAMHRRPDLDYTAADERQEPRLRAAIVYSTQAA